MTRLERLFLALALAPLAAGGLLALLLARGLAADPPLSARLEGDTAGMLMTAGSVLTLLLLPPALGLWRARVRRQRAVDAVRKTLTEQRYQFLERLDHELKNPLTAVLGRLESLADSRLDPQQQDDLAALQGQADRLRRLVIDLRRMAELETWPLERTPLAVEMLVDDVLQVAQEGYRTFAAVQDGRVLEKEVRTAPGTPLVVEGDYDFLLLALYNLVRNACKYSPDGSTVTVRALPEGNAVRIEVEDRGVGISAEDLPQVGQHLFRGLTTHHIPGSGLGLAMARTIVTRLGGRLTLTSKVGVGTIAAIHLPAVLHPPSVVLGLEEDRNVP